MALVSVSGRHSFLPLLVLCAVAAPLKPTSAGGGIPDRLADYAAAAAAAEWSGPEVELSAEPPDPGNVSPQCMAELVMLTSNTSNTTVEVLDSFGKPASGILAGNLAWLGHFDQCMAMEEFRHCLVGLRANLTEVMGSPLVLPIKWGVCAPELCSENDVRNSLELLLDILDVEWITISNIQKSAVYCTEKPNTDFDAGFIATCTLISLLAAFGILGSFVDHCQRHKSSVSASDGSKTPRLSSGERSRVDMARHNGSTQENIYEGLSPGDNGDSEINNESGSPTKQPTEKSPLLERHAIPETRALPMVIQHDARPNILVRILLCFAITRNLPKILQARQAEGGVPCLNGIRVISISWVVLGHTLIFTNYPFAVENLTLVIDRWNKNFFFQAIANAYSSVDTFFFLSGFLVTYLIMKKMKETNGKINWGWFYLHRYIRLTPSLGLLILVLVFVLPNLGQGPVWALNVFTRQFCAEWWWADLLYVNNFVSQGKNDCINWGWYLANDMQFYLLSPLIILPLFWFPAVGIGALVVTCLASFVTTAVLVYVNNLGPGMFLSMGLQNSMGGLASQVKFLETVYVKPYCRIPPYLVGMAMGYTMYRIGNQRVKMSPVLVAAGWATASGVGMAVVYGLYGASNSPTPTPMAASIAYNCLCSFSWAVAIGWVVFACHYGYGGIVDAFLSWEFWVPLSRLTYATYLFHPIVIYLYGYSLAVPFHWSAITLVYLFVSCLVLASFVALFIALLVEFPLGNLEKLLREGAGRGQGGK